MFLKTYSHCFFQYYSPRGQQGNIAGSLDFLLKLSICKQDRCLDHTKICREHQTHFRHVSLSIHKYRNKQLRSEGCHLLKPAGGRDSFTVRSGFSEARPVTPQKPPSSLDNLFQMLDQSYSKGIFLHTSVEGFWFFVAVVLLCFQCAPREDFISIFSATSLFEG